MPRYFAKQEVVSNGWSPSAPHTLWKASSLKKVVATSQLRKKMNTECEDFTDRVRVLSVGRDSRNHLLAGTGTIWSRLSRWWSPTPS